MFGRRKLKSLELRRRELVLRSSLNRLAIQVELQNVQAALRPAERIIDSVRAAQPWLMVLAPLAGILAARGLRANGAGLSRAIQALKYIPSLLGLWRQLKAASTGSAPGTMPQDADDAAMAAHP
jgi:hypothetical protein